MYIDYSKLWKLLVDKDMTKTELLEITGISSRVLAKLSKNENVTTETILRICEALQCDVCDIMECVSENKISIYNYYRKFAKIIDETDLYQTAVLVANGQKYKIHVTKKSANKSTHIHCKENGTVYWEQFYILGGFSTPGREESVLIKPQREKDEIVIVLIKGKPAVITGLDEGIFASSRGTLKTDSDVYVMSETAFKIFNPNSQK